MPNSKDREYRAMMLGIEHRAEGEEVADEMVVSGYATTFNEPYLLWSDDYCEVWEQVDSRAFDNADMSDCIMQYDHHGRVFARVKNDTLIVRPDEKGLFVRADLGGTDIGRGLYQEISGGYTDQMSFGFTVEKDERVITEEEGNKTKMLRTILSVGRLYDVSAVSIPANPNTSIVSARFLDGAIEEVRAERLKAQEEATERKRLEIKARALGGKA